MSSHKKLVRVTVTKDLIESLRMSIGRCLTDEDLFIKLGKDGAGLSREEACADYKKYRKAMLDETLESYTPPAYLEEALRRLDGDKTVAPKPVRPACRKQERSCATIRAASSPCAGARF